MLTVQGDPPKKRYSLKAWEDFRHASRSQGESGSRLGSSVQDQQAYGWDSAALVQPSFDSRESGLTELKPWQRSANRARFSTQLRIPCRVSTSRTPRRTTKPSCKVYTPEGPYTLLLWN